MLTLLSSFPPASSNFKIIINEELPFCLLSGTVVLKPKVRKFTESSAVFEDGTTEENIDVVLFATGYSFSFAFLEESVRSLFDDNRSLYKRIFPPQLEKPTLAIIGLVQLTGSVMVGAEMQARWVTGIFAGGTWGAGMGGSAGEGSLGQPDLLSTEPRACFGFCCSAHGGHGHQ